MVDRAVIMLAETGQGKLEWVAPRYRLAVGSYDVSIALDRKARKLTVLNIYRIARL